MKRFALLVGGILLIVLASVGLYVYLQFDLLVQRAIEGYGSDILQAEVKVGQVKISPRDGHGEIKELHIGNPKGFSRKYALQVGHIDLALDPRTVTGDVVVVKKMIVGAPSLIYEQSRRGTNLEAFQRNVAAYIGETSPQEKRAETKLIIEELRIQGAQVQYLPLIPTAGVDLSFKLPDIHLRNLGKRRGGLTPAELTQVVVNAILSRTISSVGQAAVPGAMKRLFGR